MNLKEDEIINLIKSGFDIELIALEFDLDTESLIKIKQEIEKTFEKNPNTLIVKDNKDKKVNYKSKLKKLRENYRRIYYNNTGDKQKFTQELSQEEKEKIDGTILEIENLANSIGELNYKEKKETIIKVLMMIKKLYTNQLSIEQVEKIKSLLNNIPIDELDLARTDIIYRLLYNIKKGTDTKFSSAIDIAQSQTEDIHILLELKKKITPEMIKQNYLLYNSLKTRINNKIVKIKQKETIKDTRGEILEHIRNIATQIANNCLDIDEANRIIDAEVENIENQKVRTRFTLSREQEKHKLLSKIQTLISEEDYNIVDLQSAIDNIKKLCGISVDQALETVVLNLINKNRFNEAKELCNSKLKTARSQDSIGIYRIIKKINSSEIGYMILRLIKEETNIKDEENYYELIEKEIKSKNINLESISLGKCKDSIRSITLADIWPDKVYSKIR